MGTLRFWNKITGMALGKLCRQPWLLAGLTRLCFLLPLIIGPAAEEALSQGVSFSGITLAVAAPEGDSAPQLLEKLLPKMEEFCLRQWGQTLDQCSEDYQLEQEQVQMQEMQM